MIRGVRNGASPDWMQARLLSAGQRPISALVDITNYVMLAYGRPAHAYDLAKLTGAIFARRAQDGESVLALNGKEYTLDHQMTVIADAEELKRKESDRIAAVVLSGLLGARGAAQHAHPRRVHEAVEA